MIIVVASAAATIAALTGSSRVRRQLRKRAKKRPQIARTAAQVQGGNDREGARLEGAGHQGNEHIKAQRLQRRYRFGANASYAMSPSGCCEASLRAVQCQAVHTLEPER